MRRTLFSRMVSSVRYTESHSRVVLTPGTAGCLDGSLGAVSHVVADSTLHLRVGPSAHAATRIGDVVGVSTATPGQAVGAGETVAKVAWEGYGQSEGDELYHTVWTNIEGTAPITLPFPATITHVNPAATADPDSLDFEIEEDVEKGWIVEVKAKAADALPHLLDGGRYAFHCRAEEAAANQEMQFLDDNRTETLINATITLSPTRKRMQQKQ